MTTHFMNDVSSLVNYVLSVELNFVQKSILQQWDLAKAALIFRET